VGLFLYYICLNPLNMFGNLFELLFEFFQFADKPERKTTRAEFRVFVMLMTCLGVFFLLIYNKQWFAVSQPGLLVLATAAPGFILALGSLYVLNKMEIMYHRTVGEILSFVLLLTCLYGIGLLLLNYYIHLIV
jgi:hypothetical protein